MAQQNGKLDFSTLTELSVGGYLTPAAANSFERLRVAGSRAGINITITSNADAYRIYAVQERIFTDRYRTVYTEYAPGKVDKRYWNGRAWFRRAGTAAAAVPGTSNHGWAIAIDIANVGGFNSTFYKWLASNAPALGWSNDEGMPLGEPWHWRYSPSNDSGGGGGASGPDPTPNPIDTLPKPIQEALMAGPIRMKKGDAIRLVDVSVGTDIPMPNAEYDGVLIEVVPVPLKVVNQRQWDIIRDICSRVREQRNTEIAAKVN